MNVSFVKGCSEFTRDAGFYPGVNVELNLYRMVILGIKYEHLYFKKA